MGFSFVTEIPSPDVIRERFPLAPELAARKKERDEEIKKKMCIRDRGITCNVKNQGDLYNWDNTTIAGIMDRWREYLGHTVNFKTTCLLYTSGPGFKSWMAHHKARRFRPSCFFFCSFVQFLAPVSYTHLLRYPAIEYHRKQLRYTIAYSPT